MAAFRIRSSRDPPPARRPLGAVVLRRPGGDLARRPLNRGSARTRRAAQRTEAAAASAATAASARRRPTRPAPPFSAMSPDRRAAEHRRAGAERPRDGPVPAVADDERRLRHHLRVGEPVDHHRVRRRLGQRPAAGRFVVATTRTGSSASASSAARTSRSSGSCAVDGATSTSGRRPRAARRPDTAARTPSARSRAHAPATAADTRAAETSPPAPARR